MTNLEDRLRQIAEDAERAHSEELELEREGVQLPALPSSVAKRSNRAAVLSVRLTPEELEALSQFAEREGIPSSTLARSFIVRALRRGTLETVGVVRELNTRAEISMVLKDLADGIMKIESPLYRGDDDVVS